VRARVELIARAIMVVRGQRVILDAELAALYDVTTKALNQAVKRNVERFPNDFLIRLTRDELGVLNQSQSVTGSQRHRDPRFPPFAFTEHGAIMAASILSSPRAVEMSVYVVRAFAGGLIHVARDTRVSVPGKRILEAGSRIEQLILPEILESIRRELRVPHRVHDVSMSEVVLNRPGVVTVVGEFVAARMAEHVRMHRKR